MRKFLTVVGSSVARASVALALLFALVTTLSAATVQECEEHEHYGRMDAARSCFLELTGDPNPYLRAEGFWGLEDYQRANDLFRLAVEQFPENASYRVRWGRMYLERYQPGDAVALFEEALQLEPENAHALVGEALAAAEGFEQSAVELAGRALQADPKMVEAQELLAYLALEDVEPDKAIAEADKALAVDDEALDAMAIRATIDWLNDKDDTEWIDRILAINPVYGEAYSIAAHFFVLNRRYEEGIEFYRKALELDPRNWEARTQLGVNLMRLGQDDEAMRQLETSYNNGYQSPATVNTLRLIDSYANFITYTTPTTIVRLHKDEAELLRPYIEGELEKAIETYTKKYKITLSDPVRVEVYPDHEDFAVRTMGMPGLAALGVTFGHVVALDSPSGRPAGSYHWASTLWHELSHVFCLEATGNHVPRWFTEGLAVHEETAVSPEWGDRIQGPMMGAINKGLLLPIADLDRGFIRPAFPGQINLSYFQAGRICDYINERWGYDALLAMMHAFGNGLDTTEVVEQILDMEPVEFDRQFLTWLHADLDPMLDSYEEWQKQIKALHETAANGFTDLVIELGEQVRDLYPEYVEAGSAYELVAEAHLEKGENEAAAAELERYVHAGGRSPSLLKRLATLEEELGDPEEAAAVLDRINYIYPVNDEDLHRRLGNLWLDEGNVDGAIREFQAVVAMNPLDQASSQFNLARAYREASRNDEAMEHVVAALEAAPGYRPAQRLLLELSASE